MATNTVTPSPVVQTTPTGVLPSQRQSQPTPIVQSKPVLRPMAQELNPQTRKGSPMNKSIFVVIGVILALLFGTGSGYFLWLKNNTSTTGGLKNEPGLQREVSMSDIKPGTKVGVADERAFRDSAEGVLEKGGIDGEGSHHIKRPGGDSQTIFITSSVIDLDQFDGRKVKIWGETFTSQKAGWFMDVGKLEVIE